MTMKVNWHQQWSTQGKKQTNNNNKTTKNKKTVNNCHKNAYS